MSNIPTISDDPNTMEEPNAASLKCIIADAMLCYAHTNKTKSMSMPCANHAKRAKVVGTDAATCQQRNIARLDNEQLLNVIARSACIHAVPRRECKDATDGPKERNGSFGGV